MQRRSGKAHRHLEDRFQAPLQPRRELVEALCAYAVHVSALRRRRRSDRLAPINRVADQGGIWCQLSQAKLIRRYRAHLAYLMRHQTITPRTLSRHLLAMRRASLVIVTRPVRRDRSGGFIREHNVYTITRTGILWIRRHARALRIPSVV
jgi:DNA-binding transcriptional ArsR family regulator